MRATIVVDDNMVLVDGVPCAVDCSPLAAENKHAVQSYDTFGEVEFRSTVNPDTKAVARLPNEVIDDFSPYQSYLDAWAVEKERQDELIEQRNKAMEEMALAGQQAAKDERQKLKDEIVAEVLARLKTAKA